MYTIIMWLFCRLVGEEGSTEQDRKILKAEEVIINIKAYWYEQRADSKVTDYDLNVVVLGTNTSLGK